MIKTNKKLFKLITVVLNFVGIFLFGKNHFMIQIQTIENCKTKIFTQVMAYIRLAINFLQDRSKQKNKWTKKQFIKLIEPLLAINASMVDNWNCVFLH